MKRIALVINYLKRGGPGRVVQNIAKNIPFDNYEVSIITLFSSNNDERIVKLLEEYGISVISCKTLSKKKCFLGSAKEFYELIKEKQFDIVHGHGIIPDILSSKLSSSVTTVSTIHNNMFEDYINCYGKIKGNIFIKVHLKALKKIDSIVCCSKSVYEELKKEISHKGMTYICNGIDDTMAIRKISRQDLAIPADATVFVYAGDLSKGKRIDWLIKKFSDRCSSKEYLLVLGDGELLEECKQNANSNVIFVGYTNDPIAYFIISDIYLSASKSEGFSIAVLEAMDCGLKLMLSNIPSHNEVINNSKIPIGVLFDDNSIDDAFEEISKIKTNRNSIITYKNNLYSAKIMTKQYIDKCY